MMTMAEQLGRQGQVGADDHAERHARAARLVEANVGLAAAVARQFTPCRGLQRADLRQEALLGVWHAARRFDPARGLKFSTYAAACARGFVLRALRRTQGAVRETAAAADHADDLLATLPDCRTADPADALAAADQASANADALAGALSRLPEWHCIVLTGRYLDGRTAADLANRLRVSKERVRQLEAAALRRLAVLLVPA